MTSFAPPDPALRVAIPAWALTSCIECDTPVLNFASNSLPYCTPCADARLVAAEAPAPWGNLTSLSRSFAHDEGLPCYCVECDNARHLDEMAEWLNGGLA
jgi:hypothetical protein